MRSRAWNFLPLLLSPWDNRCPSLEGSQLARVSPGASQGAADTLGSEGPREAAGLTGCGREDSLPPELRCWRLDRKALGVGPWETPPEAEVLGHMDQALNINMENVTKEIREI